MPATPALQKLRDLLEATDLSQVALARALGRDPRAMRRWLAGEPIPDTLGDQLARVVRVEVTRDRIAIVMTRD